MHFIDSPENYIDGKTWDLLNDKNDEDTAGYYDTVAEYVYDTEVEQQPKMPTGFTLLHFSEII